MQFSIQEVLDILRDEQYRCEASTPCIITNAATLVDASENSLVWIKPGNEKHKQISDLKASLIICNEEAFEKIGLKPGRSYIMVKEPKRIFSKIVNKLFIRRPKPGVHPTAFIHPEAKIGKDCSIGPFSYIGKCTIGEGSTVYGNCYLYDNVHIGSEVVIHAGVVIGSDGFGYAKNKEGEAEKFPHIGGVVIGDRVEIGSNTCIDRGALGNTIVKDGVKIDNLVHVAHNVVIGENAFITANAMIAGSTTIGSGAWIAPSASLLQQLNIGKNSTVGAGAVVTKNVPEGEVWTGVPARPLKEFLTLQKKMKEGLSS